MREWYAFDEFINLETRKMAYANYITGWALFSNEQKECVRNPSKYLRDLGYVFTDNGFGLMMQEDGSFNFPNYELSKQGLDQEGNKILVDYTDSKGNVYKDVWVKDLDKLMNNKKENNNSFYSQMEKQAREELIDVKNYIGAKKYDSGKTRFDLVPIECIEYLAKIYTMGANKYGDNNWQGLDNFQDRYYSALMRHLAAHRKGEYRDEESGYFHIGHAAWNAIALLWHTLQEEGYEMFYKEFMHGQDNI